MERSSLPELAKQLQNTLSALQPRIGEPRLSRGFRVYLLRKVRRLKLKMYQEKGHSLPHLHIDYGTEHHSATFGIDPPRRLDGALPSREEAVVLAWVAANKNKLAAAWRSFQDGNPDMDLLADLRGGT